VGKKTLAANSTAVENELPAAMTDATLISVAPPTRTNRAIIAATVIVIVIYLKVCARSSGASDFTKLLPLTLLRSAFYFTGFDRGVLGCCCVCGKSQQGCNDCFVRHAGAPL
jgi:hypothetical protein